MPCVTNKESTRELVDTFLCKTNLYYCSRQSSLETPIRLYSWSLRSVTAYTEASFSPREAKVCCRVAIVMFVGASDWRHYQTGRESDAGWVTWTDSGRTSGTGCNGRRFGRWHDRRTTGRWHHGRTTGRWGHGRRPPISRDGRSGRLHDEITTGRWRNGKTAGSFWPHFSLDSSRSGRGVWYDRSRLAAEPLRDVFGICDSALAFFGSYLSGRKQIVFVLGRESEPSSLYGVPQGSVVSPILFILYTQPLSDIIERHSVLHHMFADDTVLYNSAPRSSTDSVSDVKKWPINNKLQMNEDKTEALLFDPTKSSDLPDALRIGQSDICLFDILPVI